MRCAARPHRLTRRSPTPALLAGAAVRAVARSQADHPPLPPPGWPRPRRGVWQRPRLQARRQLGRVHARRLAVRPRQGRDAAAGAARQPAQRARGRRELRQRCAPSRRAVRVGDASLRDAARASGPCAHPVHPHACSCVGVAPALCGDTCACRHPPPRAPRPAEDFCVVETGLVNTLYTPQGCPLAERCQGAGLRTRPFEGWDAMVNQLQLT
eukprot:2117038-Prymnesium_polylepis.1